jgi:hypothetical protein
MASTTDLIVEMITSSIVDSLKSNLEGKIDETTLAKIPPIALLAAKAAVPFPLRIALDLIPASTVQSGVNTATSGASAVGTAALGGISSISSNLFKKKT